MHPFIYISLRYCILITLLFLIPLFTVIVFMKIIDNHNVTAILLPLVIFWRLYVYRYILNKLIFKEYKKIIVKTELKTITWNTAFGFFIIHTAIDVWYPILLLFINHCNDLSYLKYLLYYFVIHYTITVALLNRYIKLENKM